MSGNSVLILFGLSCLLSACCGTVYPPTNGTRLTLLKGSTARISWRFDGVGTINGRAWYFQSIDASREETIALLPRNNVSDIPKSSLPRVNVEVPATLILQNVTEKYNGTYRFDLFAAGGGESSVVVYIAVTPSVWINCSSVTTVNRSDDFTCVCKGVGGNPPAQVTWYKGNKTMDTGVEEATLRLGNVTKNDSGNYTCEAKSHEKAKSETEIELIVNYPPEGTSLKISYVGTSVNVTCNADALPRPTYKILRNGTVVATGKIFTIHEITNSSVGNYTCCAENFLGQSCSMTRFLSMKKPPEQQSTTLQIRPSTTQIMQLSGTNEIQFSTVMPIQPSTTVKSVVASKTPKVNPPEDEGDSDEISTNVIVGAACGGVGLIVIVTGVIIYVLYKKGILCFLILSSDVNPNGSKVITNHYELEEDQLEGGGNTYDTAKPPDKGEESQNNAEQKPLGDSLPPVYASVNKDNRQGNTLYASLDSEALKRPSQKKPAENQPKTAPTEYASIDFMKTAKTPNDDSVST